MAERRFTRLKASLSETAAKARESVSRELRQSMVNECEENEDFEDDYEKSARLLEEVSGFAFPEEDIQVSHESSLATHLLPNEESIGGGFARSCLRQLELGSYRVTYNSLKYFGSVFECFDSRFELLSHVFSNDEFKDEPKLIRSSNCLMNRMTGSISLFQTRDSCLLSFFRDRKREQIVWSQEINQNVFLSNNNTFKVESHVIEVENAEIWVKDINEMRFDQKRHVARLKADPRSHIDAFSCGLALNPFATVELSRSSPFSSLRERSPEVPSRGVLLFSCSLEVFESRDSKEWFRSRVSLFDSHSGRLSEDVFSPQKRRLFSIDLSLSRFQDLFLVARVERTLCGQHWEPYCWSARPVFRDSSLDCETPFSLFYRSHALSDEHLVNALQTTKGTTLSGRLGVTLRLESEQQKPDVTSLLSLAEPINTFCHSLLVNLQSLRFGDQKVFAKARNLCIGVEVRDNDCVDSKPLEIIETKEGVVCQQWSAVTRHNSNPDFFEEIRIRIPLVLSEKLHVLFRLFHVSCKKECLKTSVGFAWLPLTLFSPVGQQSLSVFATLNNGYLQCQALGLGRGLSMPDMKLVSKELLRVNCRLVSSLMSSDVSIEKAMESISSLNSPKTDISKAVSCERSLNKHLRALSKADKRELTRFSHVILQEVLTLSARPLGSETLRFCVSLLQQLPDHVLHSFIEDSFRSECDFHVTFVNSFYRLLRDWNSEDESETRALLRHCSFFLKTHLKSSIEYLVKSDSLRKAREKRFDSNFNESVKRMTISFSNLIVSHSRLDESSKANRALSHYFSRLLSFCDRALVFSCISSHLANTSSRDIVIAELRLTCLAIITAHEHFIPLNNPLHETEIALDSEFRRKHFTCFLLLTEFRHCLRQSVRHTRQQAIQVLRNLLAKQSFDSRYDSSRVISSLYFPIISIILENSYRIIDTSRDLIREERKEHLRSNSLPLRFDAFNCDEIRDLLIVFLFVSQYLTPFHANSLNEERSQQYIAVLETAVNHFQFQGNTPRAHTLDCKPALQDFLHKQNLSVRTATIALRVTRLLLDSHADAVLDSSLALLITLLTIPQSVTLVSHAFDHCRLLAHHFSPKLFSSSRFPSLVSRVVYYCDSPIRATREASVDLLLSLFEANFRRTRFETIVCVSRLASKDDAKDLSRFQQSLSRLELLADERLQQTVQRIKDILLATHRIRSEARNQYESSELRLFLANSYAQTSLRRTWLENLAETHRHNQDWLERAMCIATVVAVVVHELSNKGLPLDSSLLTKISPNLAIERFDTRDDCDWLEPDQTSVETLRSLIEDCVSALELSDLPELAIPALRLLLELHENQRQHKLLSSLYTRLSSLHSRAQQLNDSGKRLFSTYFRVAFCTNGSPNDEFIYREPKVVSLAEMTQKLRKLYPNSIVGDNSEAQILVTHVSPLEEKQSELERHIGVNRFQFEQRLSSSESRVSQQRKRRVVLVTQHFLPFCVKRVPIIERIETILAPIQVAIDEMADRVRQLERVIASQDVKHLQLVLQGSVQTSVNVGPLAYAEAFLSQQSDDILETRLRALFEQFVCLCDRALKLNERLIKSDQLEYQSALQTSFDALREKLPLVSQNRSSVEIFDQISGSSLA